MLWHEQKWPFIDAADKQLPVVVPLGSCEQHGHHLPLFTDSIQVAAVAEGVQARLAERILMAPTLWLGSSHHHLDFPGTLSLLPSLYSQVIKSVAHCILSAGFSRIFFLNGHGGNETPVKQALSELVAEDDRADDACLVISSWWTVGQAALEPGKLGMTSSYLSHACEYETSFMLMMRPDLVDMARATKPEPVLIDKWHNSEHDGRVAVFHRFQRLTSAGAMGSPKQATADKGRAILDGVIDQVTAFLADFAAWPPFKKVGPSR